MAASTGELRRYPRVHVDVQANVCTADGRKLLARTRDLSRSGICVITTEPLASGEKLFIELILLLGPGSASEPLPLHARVVWCTSIARSFQIGAMFDGLSTKQSSFLDMFLRYLDGSILPAGAEMDVLGDDEQADPDEQDEHDHAHLVPDDKDDPFLP